MYSALFPVSFPLPSLLLCPRQQKNTSPQSTRLTGVWKPLYGSPAGPWDPKVPETRGVRAKKLHLDEIYRSVPAMSPGTDRKASGQILGAHRLRTFCPFQS